MISRCCVYSIFEERKLQRCNKCGSCDLEIRFRYFLRFRVKANGQSKIWPWPIIIKKRDKMVDRECMHFFVACKKCGFHYLLPDRDANPMKSPIDDVLGRVREEFEDQEVILRTEAMKMKDSELRYRELKKEVMHEFHEIEQILGQALGYPRYCDDQKNFPGTRPTDGVCVGDHVAATLASEAAATIHRLRAENEKMKSLLEARS